MKNATQKARVDAATAEPRAPSMTHRTMSGMFWLLSGSGVQAVLRVAVIVVMARLLGPADFGLVAGALVLIDFVEVFSDLGIGLVIVQRDKLERDTYARASRSPRCSGSRSAWGCGSPRPRCRS